MRWVKRPCRYSKQWEFCHSSCTEPTNWTSLHTQDWRRLSEPATERRSSCHSSFSARKRCEVVLWPALIDATCFHCFSRLLATSYLCRGSPAQHAISPPLQTTVQIFLHWAASWARPL